MPTFCMHCGTEVAGKFCANCGKAAPVGSMKFLGQRKAASMKKAATSGTVITAARPPPRAGLRKDLETEEEAAIRREGTVKITCPLGSAVRYIICADLYSSDDAITTKVRDGNSDIYLRFKEGEDPVSRAANDPLRTTILKEGRPSTGKTGHPGLNKKATQKGVIQLARIRKVIAISDDQFERANVFCITYENWHLYAEAASTSDAYDWVERIKKAAYAARKLNKFLAFDDPWFVGTLADAEVKQQLESANIGDFLVRQSPRKPTDFCLHVKKSPAKTTSFPIDERDGCFQIRSNRTSNPKVKEACDIKFKTLAQMIKAFSKGGGNVKLAGAVFGMVLLKPAERDTIAPMFASKFSGGSRGASKKKPKPKKQKSKKVKKKAIIAKPADGADGADAVTFFAAEGGGSSVGSEDGSAVYGPNGGDDADADADSPPPLPGKTTNLGHAAVAPAISGDLDDLGGGSEDGLDEEESFEEQDGLDAGYIDTEVLDASEDEDDGDEAAAAEEEEEEEEEFRSPVEHAYGSAGETSDDDEEFGGFEDDDINPPPLPARIANPDSQSLGGFFDENVTDDEFEDDIYEDIDGLEDGDDDGALGDESDDDGDTPPPIPGRAGGGSWGFGEGDNDA